jgi:hypothetical protein
MAKKTETVSPPEKAGRIQQFRDTYQMSKRSDPRIGWWILGSFLVVGALGAVVFFVVLPTGDSLLGKIVGVVGSLLFGTLAALIVFGRRAQKAAYSQMEGQPGAAAAALRMLRRGWKTEPAIAFTKQQDVVHRVVGPPGIVLIGEGNINRLRPLLSSERRRHERVASETTIHEVVVGHDPGQVPLAKLNRHVTKLGKTLKPAQMTDVLQRLKALDANRSSIPMPKGPVPTSMKGMRGQMRGR